MGNESDNPNEKIPTGRTHRTLAERVLRTESDAILRLLDHIDNAFDDAVERIATCTGMVIVGGLGKSGIIGSKLSATLASTGTPSHFLHPAEAMHGDLGRIRMGDIVILLSHSGETDEVLTLAAVLQQDNVPVFAITGNRNSHLAQIADIHLCVGDISEACPLNLAPTASTTATLALCDALAMCVSEHRRFTESDFKKRHPGGNLGRLMTPVIDVLRFHANENLPLVSDALTVEQVLTEAAKFPRRAGAVILVDQANRLTGIFTDADLRRTVITYGGDAMDKPIVSVMTKNPRSLTDDALVKDAVQLVREMRVDELPVVDSNNHPVGMIDVQDLIAMKVVEG